MFNTSPTPAPSAPKPQVEPYKVFSSLKNHPIYYALLFYVTVLVLNYYPISIEGFSDFLNILTKKIVVILLLATIFSNLSTFKKRKYGLLIVVISFVPLLLSAGAYIFLGILSITLIFVFMGLVFLLLQFAAEHPSSKKGWLVVGVIILGLMIERGMYCNSSYITRTDSGCFYRIFKLF